jgi:hypothetical protein
MRGSSDDKMEPFSPSTQPTGKCSQQLAMESVMMVATKKTDKTTDDEALEGEQTQEDQIQSDVDKASASPASSRMKEWEGKGREVVGWKLRKFDEKEGTKSKNFEG